MDQTFVPYVWMVTVSLEAKFYEMHQKQRANANSSVSLQSWNNQHIHWQPNDFCGIKSISLPTDVLWKPDLTIEEM